MPLRMEYNPTTWRKPEGGAGSEVSQHPSDSLHKVQSYLEWVKMGHMLVNECVCVCVWQGVLEKKMWKFRREVENTIALGLPRWRWYLFSLARRAEAAHFLAQLLSFRTARAHALMPAGWPCIVIIQASCSHHVSSDQRRVYKVKGSCKIYAYMAVAVSGKINTAGLMHRNDWVLSDTKSTGRLRAAFAVQGIECIRALIIVCSPYISLSLGLFFDNNYDCGV